MRKEKLIYAGLFVAIIAMLLTDNNFSFFSHSTSRVFNLAEFKLTRINLECEVFITHGANEKLVVEASNDMMKHLEINQANGILSISNKKRFSLFGFAKNYLNTTDRVKIYINHSQLDRIIVNNQATIISVDYKPIRSQVCTNNEDRDTYDDERPSKNVFSALVKAVNISPDLFRNLFRSLNDYAFV